MTDRWLNYVLSIVVVVGVVLVAMYERPRLAEERAELLDQDVVEVDDAEYGPPGEREPLELRARGEATSPADDAADDAAGEAADDAGDGTARGGEEEPTLGAYGVSASHPLAVEVGMTVLEAGGNAVDAAVAVSYALGVVEPFGSGPGGGGSLLLQAPGAEPQAYDYREVAPASGEVPASNIGVPGFVAGLDHVHDEHGSLEIADLIEPAARLAEDGFEVGEYLHDRLRAAGARLPIHLAPRLFPAGAAIGAGEVLRQPEYAEALRAIQEDGPDVVYGGWIGEEIADAVSGLELADLEDYSVAEVTPTRGVLGDRDVISGGAPTSGATVIQILQIAEALGVAELDPDGAEWHHLVAQAWRLALSDRTELVADPDVEDVPLPQIVEREHTDALAGLVPADGFAPVTDGEPAISPESDTTHLVVVDEDGVMVSATNTLSNFFGSGLPISGFFLNDQLKNFSSTAGSVNRPAAGKRPRSFIAPTIVVDDGDPVLGIGTPGGRRIPLLTAQVLLGWAHHGVPVQEAVQRPRFHLEGRRLEFEQAPSSSVADQLAAIGYEVTTEVPVTEYFGGMQALWIDHADGEVDGVADERRPGAWDAARR